MNVLLTCAGRRNYLVSYFRQALGNKGMVFATDVSDEAPAMQEADRAFVVPRVDAPEYVNHLLSLCQREKVGLLASVNDLELPVLAKHLPAFEAIGTRMAVSTQNVADLAFDKWRTREFLHKCDLVSPRTALSLEDAKHKIEGGEMVFPLVVKPRWGTASISVELVHDWQKLELTFRLVHLRMERTMLADASATDSQRSVLIQECLEGEEYGLDVVNDLEGNNVTTFVKRKLCMRAGETDRAVTVDDSQLYELGCLLGRSLGHVGNLDCDVFLTPQGPRVLEINPRFGGGYPFSHMAGANLPAALLAWAAGKEPQADWLRVRPGVCCAKCDRLVVKRI